MEKDVKVVVVEAEEFRRMLIETIRAAIPREAASDWVDGSTFPLGRRRFNELAREQAFPARKPAKKWIARRSDVDAYLTAQAQQPVHVAAPVVDDPVAAALASRTLCVLKG